jgi:hypothetical protein
MCASEAARWAGTQSFLDDVDVSYCYSWFLTSNPAFAHLYFVPPNHRSSSKMASQSPANGANPEVQQQNTSAKQVPPSTNNLIGNLLAI